MCKKTNYFFVTTMGQGLSLNVVILSQIGLKINQTAISYC